MKKLKLILTSAITFLLISCASLNMESSWNENSIVIDGGIIDWEGKLRYLPEQKITVGIQNDKKNLYLCITCKDKSKILQILNLGLTAKFDPLSDNGKILGLKYPLRTEQSVIPKIKFKDQNKSFEKEKMISNFIMSKNEFRIVNEDDFPLYSYTVGSNVDYKASIKMINNIFVYEVQMPLALNKNSPLSLDAMPGETIKITVSTNEPDFKRKSGDSSISFGNNDKARKGSAGKGQKGRPNRNSVKSITLEPIEFSTEIVLAKEYKFM